VSISDEKVCSCLLQLASDRGPDKTVCPSEVARALEQNDWRALMPQVREVGVALAKSGQITVMQKGQVVDPESARGPIRYRLTLPSTSQSKPPTPTP